MRAPTCPTCDDTALERHDLGHVTVDACPTCGGFWLEEDELRQAKDEVDPDLNWLDLDLWKHEELWHLEDAPRQCPTCDVAMVTARYGETPVEVDYCLRCKGIWLDAGEFEKIIAALDEEAAEMDSGEYLQATLQEAREVVAGPESLGAEWKDLGNVLRLFYYRLLTDNPRLAQAVLAIERAREVLP